MTPPFSGLHDAGVTARVAIAYLKLIRKRNLPHETQPMILIGMAVESLKGLEFRMLRSAYFSLGVWVGQHRQSSAWLTGVLYRDMMGYTFRRAFAEDYKAARHDPRVTNRGVTPSHRTSAAHQEATAEAGERAEVDDD